MPNSDIVSIENDTTKPENMAMCQVQPCYRFTGMDRTPNQLMKDNIRELLKARRKTPAELASWCHNSFSWIDKIFREERREVPTKYYVKVAKFLGVEVYQLFQPGIAEGSERRSGQDRRKQLDRRVSRAVLSEKALDVDLIHVVRAISLKGRQKAIGMLMDILNDELRRPPAKSIAADDAGHSRETAVATPAPARGPRKARGPESPR